MEETLIILKPDCMEKRLAGEVIARFEKAGFEIVASKVMTLDSAILREHYAHVADLPFFPEIEAFMSSRPVMPMILAGEGVIGKVRDLLGPTNSQEAPAGTIRGDLGTDMMRNMVHASDGPETAAAEKKRFFPELG
ncbi:nucleoside-diphosphate kinase [Coraliomargarita akajimensis]|uniref:Nucleoside diphosphate kinase n=1 Tax=Coraliomargarita akajimensis (strain DSM 45221 / IAM 15411 / JCM 23193 / KCTC 12865 / 04OKA010-24) TaxID=583355 RepID=D5EJR7_CORAD|nr:nucleoside-diphosphate kinase [Coraliomargarita akajimensis]ADE54666.1 Nucleoside-diphosphate kinase [Coraliomargarita akajimensis DSM 45221]